MRSSKFNVTHLNPLKSFEPIEIVRPIEIVKIFISGNPLWKSTLQIHRDNGIVTEKCPDAVYRLQYNGSPSESLPHEISVYVRVCVYSSVEYISIPICGSIQVSLSIKIGLPVHNV